MADKLMKTRNYKINEHQVAEKPETITIYNDRLFTAKIHVATDGSAWAAGYEFAIKGVMVGSFLYAGLPSFSKYRISFTNREAAMTAAIREGIRVFEKHNKQYPDKFPVKKVIDALTKALTPQLSLF